MTPWLRCFFAVAVLPQLTGIAAHEWLGIVALVALFAHLAARLDALAGLCRAAARRSFLALARVALDTALFLTLVVCAVSGVLVSATVLPTFGCSRRAISCGTRCMRPPRRCCSRSCWYTR